MISSGQASAPPVRGARLSLARALPLLTTIVVAITLVTSLQATSVALSRSAIQSAQDRVDRSANQLALLATSSFARTRLRWNAVASDPAIREMLTAASAGDAPSSHQVAAARQALEALAAPTDSALPAELWSADGRRLAYVGPDVRESPMRASGAEANGESPNGESPNGDIPSARPPRAGLNGLTNVDSLQYGLLYAERGRVHFWAARPVMSEGRVLGYLTQQRVVAANPQAEETLRVLGGAPLNGFYRTTDGGFWTTIGGRPSSPPNGQLGVAGAPRWRARDGEIVYAEAAVAGMPLTIVMEVPRDQILAEPRALVRRLGLLSAILTVLAASLAWGIGKRVTAPLVRLTKAAEAVAGGDYTARVPTTGADEVARLAASFNHMTKQVDSSLAALAAANRTKTDFLATMSHELRTPLNAIGGYVELLELGLRGPLTDAQLRDLARIRAAQSHLLSLINGVLDLSRFETGRVNYDLSSIPVDPFLAGLDALIAPQAASKQLTMRYEHCAPHLAVTADREKLRQVVLNLLSNAIRYTPAGGTVSLGAEVGARETVSIFVRDTGPGIARDRQEEIFEPFVQLDRTLTQSREGMGLGLAISRDLARGMGGDLSVESEVGAGSTFRVTLSAADAEPGMALAATGESAVIAPEREHAAGN